MKVTLYIYIKLIKIKVKQQIGIKVSKFSVDAFLGGLFLTKLLLLLFWGEGACLDLFYLFDKLGGSFWTKSGLRRLYVL